MPTDPVAAVLIAGQAIVGLALLFVLPGLAVGPWLLPGARTPLDVLGRGIGLSLLIVAAGCTGLAELGVLRPLALLVLVLAVTVAPLATARGRSFGRSFVRRVGAPRARAIARIRARARRVVVVLLVGVGLVAVVVLLPSRAAVGDDLLPQTSTPWFYMAVAREVADHGAVPATIVDWGQPRPFPTDYLPATAHAAGALLLLPGDLPTVFAWYRLAILAAAAVLAAVLLRRWVSTWIAILGACVLLGTVRLEAKFLDMRPETFGIVVALFAIWVGDRALAERSRRAASVAVAAAVLVFLSHAEVFLILGPAFAGLALGRSLAGGGRIDLRRPGTRQITTVVAGIGLFVAAAAIGAGLNGLIAGEFRLVGYVAADRAAPPPVPADRIPDGWVFSGDPTWDFYVASVAPGQLGEPPPSSFFGSNLLPRAILDIWPDLDGRTRPGKVTLAGLLLLPVLLWPWLDRRKRRLMLTWWAFGGALLVGSFLLFAASSTYVPARVGPRRLMPYELLVPVMTVVALLGVVDRALRPAWRLLVPRRTAMAVAGLALAVLTIGAIAPPPRAAPTADAAAAVADDEPGLTQTGYDALRWIDANLPADARILANAYTDGSILAVARRPGILDGRAVYLEDREFLAESTSLVLGARVLFADPGGPRAAPYLAAERVSHVLVATVGPTGADVGGYLLFDTNLPGLASGGRYTLVRSFGAGRLLLYQVNAGR